MKKVLSLLLAFVFLQVETWALSGGPQYGGNTAAVSGTYAGVFTGVKNSSSTRTDPVTGVITVDNSGANALGVFVLGVPRTDAAQGSIGLFANGIFFQGGMIGIADPNKGTLSGIAQLIHVYSSNSNGNAQSVTYDSRADGTITAKIERGNSSSGSTLKGTGSFTLADLVFVQTIADIEYTDAGAIKKITYQNAATFPASGTLSFRLEGFLQSNTVILPNANSTAALLNGSGTGG